MSNHKHSKRSGQKYNKQPHTSNYHTNKNTSFSDKNHSSIADTFPLLYELEKEFYKIPAFLVQNKVKYFNVISRMVGQTVVVLAKDGTQYQGVLHTSDPNGLGVALKWVTMITAMDSASRNARPTPCVVLKSEDVVSVICCLTIQGGSDRNNDGLKGGIKTDVEISGGVGPLSARELTRWEPEGEINEGLELGRKEDTNWDQFAVNERLFGVTTDFDEELYTTKLERTGPGFEEREKQALKIAEEIQRMATSNIHLMEERGLGVNESEVDEEDRYGAVVREQTKIEPTSTPKQRLQLKRTIGAKGEESSKTYKVEDIKGSFKLFASREKERVLETKNNLIQKEKKGTVEDLIKFSKNFKLKTPMPEDIASIIIKDANQEKEPADNENNDNVLIEPKEKIAKNNKEKVSTEKPTGKNLTPAEHPTSKEEKKNESGSTKANALSNNGVEADVPVSEKKSFKYNVNAPEFKPNPSAKPFIPSKQSLTKNIGFFADKTLLREEITLSDVMKVFKKGPKSTKISPLWPYGKSSYKHQFVVQPQLPEEMFVQPPYGYPYMGPFRHGMPGVYVNPYIGPGVVPSGAYQPIPMAPGAMAPMYQPTHGNAPSNRYHKNVPSHGPPPGEVHHSRPVAFMPGYPVYPYHAPPVVFHNGRGVPMNMMPQIYMEMPQMPPPMNPQYGGSSTYTHSYSGTESQNTQGDPSSPSSSSGSALQGSLT